jgi:SSS family solute:Na+ symporter
VRPLSSNLSNIDNIIIQVYFVIVLFIGVYFSRNHDNSSKQYFLAGKNLGWFAIGTSLFATNISSEHLVGLAGAGSIHGLSIGHFEWISAIILLFLGWFFAPIFLKANVYTVPQFFGKRFDDRARIYLTVVSVFAYLFLKIAVTLIAGGLVLSGVLGWDMFTSAILIVLLTGIYTITGGMYSVVNTQIFQSFMIIASAVLLSLFGFFEIGGLSGLTEKLPSGYFDFFKPFTDSNLPWTGILLGAPILGIWYWCSDQYIVQRILSAKGVKDARRGTVLASFLKIFPIIFLIFPGIIAAILYPNMKGDSAYAMLLSGSLLPIGIKGLVIAGFFSALMSSLSSSFNSTASLFTLDIYSFIKPKASENEVVLVGRLSTMVLVIISISIIPLLKMIDTHIYMQLQTLQAYIAPPIVSVFLLGIFWQNASSKGAIWALIIGGSVGFLKIILASIDSSIFSNIYLLNEFHRINYLHFAIFLFCVTSLIVIIVSLLSKVEKHESLNSPKISSTDNLYHNEEIKISSIEYQINKPDLKKNKKSEIFH